VARSLAAWAGTQSPGSTLASSGTSHATSNNGAIDFGTGLDGTANYFGIFDASTGGNLWAYIPLTAPQDISPPDSVSFDPGTLAMTLGLSGGTSDYLSNKLIDLLFRGQAYTWPATTYAAYSTTMPTNSTPGTEPSGGYLRTAIASTLTAWSATQGGTAASSGTSGRTANLAPLLAPVPSADQGDIVGMMLFDAASLGNMLFWGPMLVGGVATPVTVNASGDAPGWDTGGFGLNVR
jgi:hypothetical protein